jgi:hypothetical protein
MVEAFSITHTLTVRLELLEADRERQAGRAGADDDDVVFHGFASLMADSVVLRAVQAVAVRGGMDQAAIVRFRAPCGNACCATACNRFIGHGDNRGI